MENKKKRNWIQRLKSETPADFKWLRKWANYLGGGAMAVVALSATLDVDKIVISIATYVAVTCAAVAGTSSFTMKNYIEDEEQKKQAGGQGKE